MGFDRDAPQYPHVDGPHLILGPECFTGDGEEVPQDVIMWRGEAYTRVPPQGIDRDAVIADAMRMLYEHSPHPDREEAEELVDRMLLHGSYLTAAPDRDIIAAAIQTDFDVRSSAALRVADRILALAAEPELDARCSEGMLITEHTREAATPPQGIDRDALLVLLAEFGYDGAPDRAKLADAILALVRPVEGVTLTPEEKATVIDALRDISDMDERMAQIRPSRQREIDERRALAERLREGDPVKSMEPGVLIKRRDGGPFPDNHFWAIVREPEKKNDVFGRMWIQGGQWVARADVDFVPMEAVIEQAWGASEQLPPVAPSARVKFLEEAYEGELKRRRRQEKRAAKANDEIEPMRAEVRKAKKLIADLRLRLGSRFIEAERDRLNAAKLDLIKQIVDDRALHAD